MKVDNLTVNYRERRVGTLSLTPDNKLCVFEYDGEWLSKGFSISPLELPLRTGLFVAKPQPFYGDFGVFEDSLPDGYGRYLLHKTLLRQGINDSNLSAIDRLSIVGEEGMGALTYRPVTSVMKPVPLTDFDLLQEKALEVLKEQQEKEEKLRSEGKPGTVLEAYQMATNRNTDAINKFNHNSDVIKSQYKNISDLLCELLGRINLVPYEKPKFKDESGHSICTLGITSSASTPASMYEDSSRLLFGQSG